MIIKKKNSVVLSDLLMMLLNIFQETSLSVLKNRPDLSPSPYVRPKKRTTDVNNRNSELKKESKPGPALETLK